MSDETRRDDATGTQAGPGDYFVVDTVDNSWCVSARMAGHVEKTLTARWPAPWVSFVDIHGARITVRTHRVNYVAQCYAGNRAAWRAFNRAHGAERKADPDWDDD